MLHRGANTARAYADGPLRMTTSPSPIYGVNPFGSLDSVTAKVGNAVVRGWAIDANTANPIAVHVYVDGKPFQALTADGNRPGHREPLPGLRGRHGYSATLKLPSGRHTICTYGINVGPGHQQAARLQGRDAAAEPVRLARRGEERQRRDQGVGLGDRSRHEGADLRAPLPRGRRRPRGARRRLPARPRPDVRLRRRARLLDDAARRRGATHTVCAYGINRGPGANTLLGCKTRLTLVASLAHRRPSRGFTLAIGSGLYDATDGGSPDRSRVWRRSGDGYIGLDYVAMDQVDHVLDLTKEPYPFEDRSVDAVFSAHFLEHIEEPNHVFSEIGRICKDGAKIEFWTPYAFTNEAFLYGHLHFLTEETWMHFCVLAPRRLPRDARRPLAAQPHRLRDPARGRRPRSRHAGFTLDFAVRYLKGVVIEFGVEIEFQCGPGHVPSVIPERVYVTDRFGEQRPLACGAQGPLPPLITDGRRRDRSQPGTRPKVARHATPPLRPYRRGSRRPRARTSPPVRGPRPPRPPSRRRRSR